MDYSREQIDNLITNGPTEADESVDFWLAVERLKTEQQSYVCLRTEGYPASACGLEENPTRFHNQIVERLYILLNGGANNR